MGTTYGALQTKISKKLIDAGQTAIAGSDVGDAINDALHYWKYRRFWFNELQTTLTMDINDPFVFMYGISNANTVNYPNAPVLPQEFLYEFPDDGFVIYYNQLRYPIVKRHPLVFDSLAVGAINGGAETPSGSGLGLPFMYTFRQQTYEFYFYPNLNYSLVVNYIEDYPDLVNSSDTNDFLNYADRLIMYEALSHLYGENRQDQQMEGSFFAKADREYENIKMKGFQQQESGVLTTENIL
jgi:hypothetical protein